MKTLWYKKLTLIFLLLLAGITLFPQKLKIEGNAKFIRSDNNKFKNYKLNTSSWRKVKIPSDLKHITGNDTGILWYRIFINKNTVNRFQSPCLLFKGVSGNFSVFINGHKISEIKGFKSEISKIQIPLKYIKNKNENLIAVKVNDRKFNNKSGIYAAIYLGSSSEITSYLEKRNTIYTVIYVIFITFAVIFLFIFNRKIKNYGALFISAALLCAGLFVYFNSISGIKLLSSALIFFKLEIFLLSIFAVLLVLFLNTYYKVGFNKLDIIFYVLISIVLIFTVLVKKIIILNYIYASIIIFVLIPAIHYSILIFRKVVKGNIPSYFFQTGIFVTVIYSFVIYFVNMNNAYLKILFVCFPATCFSLGYLFYYFTNFNELIENKYLLENRVLESNIIVADKNKSFLDLDEEMKDTVASLANAYEISSIINDKIKYAIPEIADFDFDILYHTNKKISGDILRVVDLDNGLRFILIDYPGDEISTSFLNVITEYEIRNSLKSKNPSTIINKINDIFIDYGFQIFITATIIDIFPDENKIKYVNAGSPNVIVVENNEIKTLESCGTVLGLEKEKYKDKEIQVQEKSQVIIFTDGLMHQIRKNNKSTFEEFISKIKPDKLYQELKSQITDNKENILDDIILMKIGLI